VFQVSETIYLVALKLKRKQSGKKHHPFCDVENNFKVGTSAKQFGCKSNIGAVRF
jgi:hypothetical protein